MRLTVDVPPDLARVEALLLEASVLAALRTWRRSWRPSSGIRRSTTRADCRCETSDIALSATPRDASTWGMTRPQHDRRSAAGVAHGRRVFRNTLITGVVGVLSLLANFFVIAFGDPNPRHDPYGVLVLALAFSVSAGYLSISDLGLQAGVTRFVADADGRGQRERIERGGQLGARHPARQRASSRSLVLLALACWRRISSTCHGVASQKRSASAVRPVRGRGAVRPARACLLRCAAGTAALRLDQGRRHVAADAVHGRVADRSRSPARVSSRSVPSWSPAALFAAIGYAVVARLLVPGACASRHVSSAARALRPLAGFSGWVFVAAIIGVIWAQMDTVILATSASASTCSRDTTSPPGSSSAASYPLSFTAPAVVPAAANLSRDRIDDPATRTADSRHSLHAGPVPPRHHRRA